VIWELEPGARILEKAGLPKVGEFDEPRRVDAFLDAVRWGAATNADVQALQAPFRSGIAIEDYQLDPLVRGLQMPRVNLLIADDVGLGKTIEAGLVAQELLLRHRARTILIVCPASLQLKWQAEMQEKFGLEFRVVDTSYLKELRRSRGIHANPWSSFPRLITSMDWLKSEIPLRFMRDAIPPVPSYPRTFDLLIVDEAHNVAPSAPAKYALDACAPKHSIHPPHFENRCSHRHTAQRLPGIVFTSLLESSTTTFRPCAFTRPGALARVMVRSLEVGHHRANETASSRTASRGLGGGLHGRQPTFTGTRGYTQRRRPPTARGGSHATASSSSCSRSAVLVPAAFAGTLDEPQDLGGRKIHRWQRTRSTRSFAD